MAVAKLLPAFSLGEVSPSLYGRYDLARMGVAASTARNFFVRYQGGMSSRAGTKFVGFSKQTGRSFPPRMVNFQFSINQGLALEFGHFYMRVIQNGAFVTEPPLAISNITQADPAVVSSSGSGATAATPITSGVLSSYAPGDTIVLAGGTFLTATELSVTNTKVVSVSTTDPGIGNYAPGDTINLSGGTQTVTPVVTVATTQVVSATVAAGGSGGTDGTQTVTGTTGTGTPFQASVTVAGGAITAVLSITVAGSYTVNPTTPATEPVTGASLSGAQLDIVLGVRTATATTPGTLTANPASDMMTQASTSGSGSGVEFQAIFGPNAVSITEPGVYSVTPSNPVAQDTTSGTGLGATFTMTYSSVAAFNDGDWVYITGVIGMTEVNGETYVVASSGPTSFALKDVYGNDIDSSAFSAYVSGGTVARIYTVTSPYAEQDLAYLKWTQSADVMSICCVNQQTSTEYPPYDLTRNSNTDWSFVELDTNPEVDPPTNVSGSASSSGTTWYQYQVTSIDPDNGTESIASSAATISNAVNISATAGNITISWTPPAGVSQFNVYKATPAFSTSPPVGALFGFAGYAFGAQFIDSNITPDFTQVPPLAKNPFAPGQILGASTVTPGSGYTTATASITTSTGSGAELQCVIVNGGVVAFVLITGGQDYADGDTITITGDGTGATAVLRIGPASGTYPGTVSYFQQRRAYAYTLNTPDTYFFSQPGAFKNFDSRIPASDSDAIIGSPWSLQVNGIQWMVPMPGGLVVMTGLSAWQLTGNGGSSLNPQPLTPAGQQAQPQAFNGISATVPPVRIDNDIVYVQAKGSIYRNLSYEILSNIYTGADLTLNSSQLFNGFTVVQHAWCEEPYKLLWVVRDDGALICLTFVKSQEVAGWTRHDTNGEFVSVCSVTELPVDVPYFATQRYPDGNTAYMIERMDDRIWDTLDTSWCVDCAIALDQPTPAATLTASSATGLGALDTAIIVSGGTNYSAATTATVVDDNGKGPGTGGAVALTITAGVITGAAVTPGSGYVSPKVVITDPAGTAGGSGGEITLTLDNSATFTASASIFTMGNVGDIIRMGGGVAEITGYTSGTEVTANITTPITDIRPNTDPVLPNPQTSGNWTLTTPVSSISGLKYLAGATVTGLADGVVIDPVTVPDTGIIDLPQPSTSVVVGLGFTCQLQSVYLNAGDNPTIQGQRKKIADAAVRVQASGEFEVGANQPDGAAQSPIQIAPEWSPLTAATISSTAPFGSTVKPLYTGDTVKIPVEGGYDVRGQFCVQQSLPKPLNILSFEIDFDPGDTPELKVQERQAAR